MTEATEHACSSCTVNSNSANLNLFPTSDPQISSSPQKCHVYSVSWVSFVNWSVLYKCVS